MRIARVKLDGNETYGFVKNGSISVRDEMIDNTGIPLPPEIKQFLFDGWFEEVMRKNPKLPYALKITDVKLLAPIPNPPKIICLAFNYPWVYIAIFCDSFLQYPNLTICAICPSLRDA